MATQQQRSQATKALLLETFRSTALEVGYAATTTSLMLSQTGLSKGAMYHHFRSKADMMLALYRQESQGAFDRAMQQAAFDGSALSQLKSLYLAWMEEVLDPTVSKILFEIGPSALGPGRAKQIEDEVTLETIEAMLRDAQTNGEIGAADTQLVAALLNALVGEAALHRLRTGKDTTPALALSLDGVLAVFQSDSGSSPRYPNIPGAP